MSSESSPAAVFILRGFKAELRRILPLKLWELLHHGRLLQYRMLGRPTYSGESSKARARRTRENFFAKYCVGRGLDIGYGGDLLSDNCTGWDLEHGDAQYLASLDDESFDFVYSSHTLEHVADASDALRNWDRVVKPGGYLIVSVPDRDLYEKKPRLPSRWNTDHKRFFLLEHDEPPDTVGLLLLLAKVLPDATIVSTQRCAEGHTIADPLVHSDGEYSLEVILRKPRR
jgi:SAM-dependent methyltransferase